MPGAITHNLEPRAAAFLSASLNLFRREFQIVGVLSEQTLEWVEHVWHNLSSSFKTADLFFAFPAFNLTKSLPVIHI